MKKMGMINSKAVAVKVQSGRVLAINADGSVSVNGK